MEIIRRNTDYALRTLVLLADADKQQVFVVEWMAKKTEVPEVFLRKILQKLCNAGIVDSCRGRKGGFSLNRDPRQITVLEIVEAVQGPVAINRCFLDEVDCSQFSKCDLKARLVDLQSDLVKTLESVSLAELT